jgi:hypothetical protein
VGNFAGARQDAIHQPAVGNSRTSSYDTDWEPKSRLTKDNCWEKIDLPPSAIPFFKVGIPPRIDQPCAAAEA